MRALEKLAQPRQLGDVLGRQGLGDQWRLWFSPDFVQVPGRCRLGHELMTIKLTGRSPSDPSSTIYLLT